MARPKVYFTPRVKLQFYLDETVKKNAYKRAEDKGLRFSEYLVSLIETDLLLSEVEKLQASQKAILEGKRKK